MDDHSANTIQLVNDKIGILLSLSYCWYVLGTDRLHKIRIINAYRTHAIFREPQWAFDVEHIRGEMRFPDFSVLSASDVIHRLYESEALAKEFIILNKLHTG